MKISGLLAPQFIARRSEVVHKFSRVSAIIKYFQDLILLFVPGLHMKTIVGKSLGLDDIFLFAKKPGKKQ